MAEIKTDCFGYNKAAKKCTIMTETICRKSNCTFYKTREQAKKDADRYPRTGKYATSK